MSVEHDLGPGAHRAPNMPVIWLMMALITLGAVLAGLAFIVVGPWLFAAGAALALTGGIGALAAGVMHATE